TLTVASLRDFPLFHFHFATSLRLRSFRWNKDGLRPSPVLVWGLLLPGFWLKKSPRNCLQGLLCWSGWQEDSGPPKIFINQLVEKSFEESLTFLLKYNLLGD